MRPLGATQVSVLASLKRHGAWTPGCGWLWDTPSNTRRIMDSLAVRGLVSVTVESDRRGSFHPVYRLIEPTVYRTETPRWFGNDGPCPVAPKEGQ